jgi:hypothetical protein
MIHALSICNDAAGWEIERFKDDIVRRFAPPVLQRGSLFISSLVPFWP